MINLSHSYHPEYQTKYESEWSDRTLVPYRNYNGRLQKSKNKNLSAELCRELKNLMTQHKTGLKGTFNVISDASFKTFLTSRCAPYPKSIEFALTWTSMTFELSCFLPTSLKHWGQSLLHVPQTCNVARNAPLAYEW